MSDFEEQMMQKATKILESQPDLKRQSEIREKYKFQEGEPFWKEDDDFLSEEDIERRPCTEKERRSLDRAIEKIGDLFQDANFFWQLDGALNISMYKGEYIGIHKDIDMSFDIRELDKVESFLGKKGLGLFMSTNTGPSGGKIFERVSAEKIRKANPNFHPMFFAINEDGKIKYEEDSFGIDTHLIRWYGDEPITDHGTPIPKEWLTPKIIIFNNQSINCSSPSLVVFHKLFFTRGYYDRDLKLIVQSGKLKESDIDLIEKTFDRYVENIRKIISDYVTRIFPRLISAKRSQEIFEALIDDELVKKQESDTETKETFNNLSAKISDLKNKTPENICQLIFETARINKAVLKKEDRFAMLRKNIPNK